MFASSIPEIIELVGSGSKYGGELKREHGKRYIKQNTKKNISYRLFQSIQPRMFEILHTKKMKGRFGWKKLGLCLKLSSKKRSKIWLTELSRT